MDPYMHGGRYANSDSAMAQKPLPMRWKVEQIRDWAIDAGVADVFPDEANFALNCISRLIEQNAYTPEEGDSALLRYIMTYCMEREA